jgi:hypothetical protein
MEIQQTATGERRIIEGGESRKADYRGDDRRCGSELRPVAGTRLRNDGSQREGGKLKELGAELEELRRMRL